MNEQRRVLLAFLLMMVVLAGTQWWYSRMRPDEVPPAEPDSTAVAPSLRDEEPAAHPPAVPEPVVLAPDSVAGMDRPPDEASDRTAPPGDSLAAPPVPVVIETPLYRLTIDPRGGVLRQVELLRYPSYTSPGPVRLVPEEAMFLNRAANLGGQRVALAATRYVAGDTLLRLPAGAAPATLRLVAAGAGPGIEQTYRFDADSYVIDVETRFGDPADGVLVTGLGPRLLSNEKKPREDYSQLRAVARVDGEVVDHQAGDLDEGDGVSLGGEVEWAGLRNKYFLAMVLAPADGPPLSAVSLRGEPGDSLPTLEVGVATPIVDGVSVHRLYLGPQEYSRLAALNDGLDDVNQYGWSWIRWMISPFAKAIVVVMLWLHRFIPSYGLVIVVFAVLVKIVTWPLTTKSYRSIRAMQELQPEIQRIRERHKEDPQKMQAETMRLYRERKVNPMGGCLPNLLPMPILFALFFVFQSTIEFRGQSFLWLPDLSQADPLYILPIFLGLSMLASSKLTTTSDPRMAAMTYVMPIVLTFVFLNLAAGLTLYYAISNMLMFGQQWNLKRRFDTQAAPAEAVG
ncbi:MAG TPA: membrane protein insertase YidC [Gemmatimonadota bacterium]|nr:membrane protein insertase YidC [Gemmatimonadota bacterium]